MINYIKKIFQEKKYFLEEDSNEEILFFWKKWEYFLISKYNKSELKEFFESEKTNSLIKIFENKKKNFKDIEKNTSLIILLKVDDLKKDFNELKNQIMKIEEDEYFFRKYIIIYDEVWQNEVIEINNHVELNEELNKINLEEFRKDNFEKSKWYLIIQLFIKLPFLKVEVKELKLDNLLENINKKIKKNELEELNNFILEKDYLTENENSEDFFDNLENRILDIENKEIDSFLEKIN